MYGQACNRVLSPARSHHRTVLSVAIAGHSMNESRRVAPKSLVLVPNTHADFPAQCMLAPFSLPFCES